MLESARLTRGRFLAWMRPAERGQSPTPSTVGRVEITTISASVESCRIPQDPPVATSSNPSSSVRPQSPSGNTGQNVVGSKPSHSDTGGTEAPVPTFNPWQDQARNFARKAVPIINIGASISEAVPIIGAPVKGALDALVKVLEIVEKNMQNKEDVQQLLLKITSFRSQLDSKSTNSQNVEWLTSRLTASMEQLSALSKSSSLDHANVSDTISQCQSDLSWFLQNFSVVAHIDALEDLSVIKAELAHQREHAKQADVELSRQREQQKEHNDAILALFLDAAPIHLKTPKFSITVVDPCGVEQRFSDVPTTYMAFGQMVLKGINRSPRVQRVLEKFVASNLFELSLDDGRQVAPLRQEDLHRIEADTKILMSVITFSVQRVGHVRCPLCKSLTPVAMGSEQRTLCAHCDRNVQFGQDDAHLDGNDGRTKNQVVGEDLSSLERIVVKSKDLTCNVYTTVDTDTEAVKFNFSDQSRPRGSYPTVESNYLTIRQDWEVEVCNVYNTVDGGFYGSINHFGKARTYNYYTKIEGNFYGRAKFDGNPNKGNGSLNWHTNISGANFGEYEIVNYASGADHANPTNGILHSLTNIDGPNYGKLDVTNIIDDGIHDNENPGDWIMNSRTTCNGNYGDVNLNFMHDDRDHSPPPPFRTPRPQRRFTVADDWEVGTTNIYKTVRHDCFAQTNHYGKVKTYNVYNVISGNFCGSIKHHDDEFEPPSELPEGHQPSRPSRPYRDRPQPGMKDRKLDDWGVGTYNLYTSVGRDFCGEHNFHGDVETFNVYTSISGNFYGSIG